MKRTALYYRCLNYRESVLMRMHQMFDVLIVDKPTPATVLTPEQMDRVWAVFWPIGYEATDQLCTVFPNLRYMVSNTTTTPHIKMQDAEVLSLAGDQILSDITCTAEHTLGLIHALHRRLPSVLKSTADHKWNRFDHGVPRMLSEMKLGILGVGRVGNHLFDRALELFADVIPVGPSLMWMNKLRNCDVLAICASVRPEDTQPVMHRTALETLPKGALVVNTARAELLDYWNALCLLNSGHLGGLAVDCFPGEPDPTGTELYRIYKEAALEHNLVMTPHIGGSTETAWAATQGRVVELLIERAQG